MPELVAVLKKGKLKEFREWAKGKSVKHISDRMQVTYDVTIEELRDCPAVDFVGVRVYGDSGKNPK